MLDDVGTKHLVTNWITGENYSPSPIIRTRVRKYTPVSTLYFQKRSQAIILPVYGERGSDSRIDSGSICTK